MSLCLGGICLQSPCEDVLTFNLIYEDFLNKCRTFKAIYKNNAVIICVTLQNKEAFSSTLMRHATPTG
jgi:hypothetical protein